MTRTRSLPASLLAGLTATTLALGGCAGLVSGSTTAGYLDVDLDRPEMQQFAVATMTDMERDVRLENGDRKREVTPALFWTGITLGTVGAAAAIGFGVVAYTTEQKLTDAYANGTTVDTRDTLLDRGKTFNNLTIAMVAVSVIGYALAIATYGADWNRCGPLVLKNKKRHCDVVQAHKH